MNIVFELPKQPPSDEKRNYYTGYADCINNLDPRFDNTDYTNGYDQAEKDLKKTSKTKEEEE